MAKTVEFWGAMLNVGASANDYVKVDPSISGSTPTPAYSGFGDVFGDVTAYYSLRKFTEAETLNAIRVRRSSDDTEQDIGFDANGDLDTTSLLDFVGYNLISTSDISNAVPIGTVTSTSEVSDLDFPSGDARELESTSLAYSGFTNSLLGGVLYNASCYYKLTSGNYSFRFAGTIANSAGNVVITPNGVVQSNGSSIAISNVQVQVEGLLTRLSFDFTTDKSATSTTLGYFGVANDDVSNGIGRYNDIQISIGSGVKTYSQTTGNAEGTGFITTWYDQSGNGNNATNATASEQPLVVSGGTLVTENGKAAIDFDVSSTSRLINATLSTSQPETFFSVIKHDTIGIDNNALFDSYNNVSHFFRGRSTNQYQMTAGAAFSSTIPVTTNQSLLYGVVGTTSDAHIILGNIDLKDKPENVSAEPYIDVDTYIMGAYGTGYKTSTIANRRLYIGNVSYTDPITKDLKRANDTIFKSNLNAFDTFTFENRIDVEINDGDDIIALESLGSKLLEFKRNHLYIINIARDIEFLEATLEYKGCEKDYHVLRGEGFIAWFNKFGFYCM